MDVWGTSAAISTYFYLAPLETSSPIEHKPGSLAVCDARTMSAIGVQHDETLAGLSPHIRQHTVSCVLAGRRRCLDRRNDVGGRGIGIGISRLPYCSDLIFQR